MKAIDDLKEVYPELEIWESGDGLYVRGNRDEVSFADTRMDRYVPTEYKRILLVKNYIDNISSRHYRKAV